MKVFGRLDGYDTGQDNLVRVQASQLRKKLQQYFDSEGLHEPVVIEIPKGAYTPAFRSRETAVAVPPGACARRLLWLKSYPGTFILGLLAAALAGAAATYVGLSSGSGPDPTQGPAMALFWRQVFGNGRPVCVVPSDTNLVLFQDILGRQLTVNEYRQNLFFTIANAEIANPDSRSAAKAAADKPGTNIADARLVGVVEALNTARRIHTDVVFARDFGVSYLESHNVILLGTRRANPWIELFEDQMNFRTRFEEKPHLACYFENRAPLAGERARYAVDWGRHGYCRVAFLPTPSRNGHAVLLSGTDMASTEAGGRFIAEERWFQLLRSRLGRKNGEPYPYMEILLEVDYPAARAPRFTIVAHREIRS